MCPVSTRKIEPNHKMVIPLTLSLSHVCPKTIDDLVTVPTIETR